MASPNPSHVTPASPVRVLLWSNPRSLSTVFLKSMSRLDDVQIVCELYESAFKFGPERNTKAYVKSDCEGMYNESESGKYSLQPREHLYNDSLCTYKWVRDIMESNFSGKQVVFAKDIGYALAGRYEMLPRGFQHTFLIRHPKKCFASWKKIWEKLLQTSMSYDRARANQYQTLYELMEHTRRLNSQSEPVVIDADDLQRHPESILRQYCEATRIPYRPKILEWNAGDEILNTMVATKNMVLNGTITDGGFFADAFRSTSFKPPSSSDMSSIDDDVPEQLLQATMPYYEKMYALRIKP